MRAIPAGTRVRLKVAIGGRKDVGTLMGDVFSADQLATIMCESGYAHCIGSELAVLRDQTPGLEPMRYRLPYGLWTCADGREVLFNRDYKPIWQRRPGESASAADRDEWVPYVGQEWLYDDATTPWCGKASVAKATIARCEAVLKTWGISTTPRPWRPALSSVFHPC